MKATGPPGKQSRALQSCWRWSPLWRPTTKMFWSANRWNLLSYNSRPCRQKRKLKNLKKITALLKLHRQHRQAALTSEKKNSSADIYWIVSASINFCFEIDLQRPAVDFCKSLNIENAGWTSAEANLLVFVLNCSSLRLLTRLVKIPRMAPILYGSLARLSANNSFLWSLLQPGNKWDEESLQEKWSLMLTLSDKLLQLDDVVRGAERGGHDEGEQQLLGPLHQVLQDPLDVTGGSHLKMI